MFLRRFYGLAVVFYGWHPSRLVLNKILAKRLSSGVFAIVLRTCRSFLRSAPLTPCTRQNSCEEIDLGGCFATVLRTCRSFLRSAPITRLVLDKILAKRLALGDVFATLLRTCRSFLRSAPSRLVLDKILAKRLTWGDVLR